MDARAEAFVEVSAELTGFCRVELAGTGMSEDYLAALDQHCRATACAASIVMRASLAHKAVCQAPDRPRQMPHRCDTTRKKELSAG